MNTLRSAFGFPAVVNEKAARVVAAGVVRPRRGDDRSPGGCGWPWCWRWASRCASPRVPASTRWAGSRRRVVAPRLGRPARCPVRPSASPRGSGLAFSGAAVVAYRARGDRVWPGSCSGCWCSFAALEAGIGFCAGCYVFALLMRAGVVSDETCVECADITLRRPVAAS